MAIKERLLKQLQIVRDGLNAMPPFHSRDLNAMRNALVQARDLCFQGLSYNRFAEYQDTYDGLLLAIDQLAAGTSDQGEIVSLCSELLQFTMVQTQKETTFKKEIFFLPYKASMWDSLESVWKAADEDKEHCIAYVMPIPYADLTPEHTVAEWHCERGLFPQNVPTLDWQTVNLEEIHPDVIYIHNPYDQYNRVTSVESRYYSSNLKSCTDKLVYIPYFVLDEISPGNESAEEHISGFILTPAVLNADEVIVQSEDMRQVYINVLVRNTDQKDRAYWEKRILGLGSPKIEKVLTSKKEDFELPESWAKIVKGKKIILYNTSLNAMLQNSDKVCEKLRCVFNIFKNRDDVALWWRPHPLMKATIHSMRPEIEKEYCEIEKKYIEEDWGIYDDTGNLHRAIVWSDAYYGDGSSVVQLYQKTGKSIMMQSPNSLKSSFPDMEYVAIYQDEVWFVGNAGSWQGLFYYDLLNNELIFLGKLPSKQNRFEYVVLERIGDKIIIAPYFSMEGFLEYDIKNQSFSRSSIGSNIPHDLTKGEVAFCNAWRYGKSAFFFANQCGEIIEYNGKTGEYSIHTSWRDILPSSLPWPEIRIGRHCCQLKGDTLYFAIGGTNLLVQLNLRDLTGKCYECPGINKIGRIHIIRDKIWLLPCDSEPMTVWDCKNKTFYQLETDSSVNNALSITGLLEWDEKILAIPYEDNNIYQLHSMSGNIAKDDFLTEQVTGAQTDLLDSSVQFSFLTYPDHKGRVFTFNAKGKYMMCFPLNDKAVHRYCLSSDKDIQEVIVHQGSLLFEYEGVTLDGFLHFSKKQDESRIGESSAVSSGQTIYQMISKEAN